MDSGPLTRTERTCLLLAKERGPQSAREAPALFKCNNPAGDWLNFRSPRSKLCLSPSPGENCGDIPKN